jgi:TolA-binding protein
MKSQERHKLKENEFAKSVLHARDVLETRRRDLLWGLIVVIALLASVGAYAGWRQVRTSRATDLLASALAVYEAPVVPLQEPAPGSPAPVPQAGTYRSEQAKLEAALPKFLEAADRYPSSDAGVTARYHAAGILATLGRYAEAEQRYQEVLTRAGSTLYGRTARLGLANAQVAQQKYDNAITIYTELSRDQNSQMPVDGVLMQLGRACLKAGRKEEAVRAFTRVKDEFPESMYAEDARTALEEAKKTT